MKTVERLYVNKFEVRSDTFYSSAEISKRLGITRKTICKLIANKQLKAVKPGKHYQVSGLSVIHYYQKHEGG